MLYELNPNDADKIRPMFAGWGDIHFPISGLLDGTRPGKIYVDDTDNPKSVFMYTACWYYLAGDPTNTTFNQDVHRLIMVPEFSRAPYRGLPHELFINISSDGWHGAFPTLFGQREPIHISRRHYRFDALPENWQSTLPEGYHIRKLDAALLADAAVQNWEGVQRWIRETWTGNEANYPGHGTGAVIMQGDAIVSWCLTVAVAGDKVEMGIETHPAHRRKGLGLLAAQAAVAFCQQAGFNAIDWHVDTINFGSWKIAEKAGFTLDREYTAYLYFADPVVHFAVSGNYELILKNYDVALKWYDKVFAINPDAPDWVCFMAARAYAGGGQDQKALSMLNAAIDKGWVQADSLDEVEFTALHQTPAWKGVLEQMREKHNLPQSFDLTDEEQT